MRDLIKKARNSCLVDLQLQHGRKDDLYAPSSEREAGMATGRLDTLEDIRTALMKDLRYCEKAIAECRAHAKKLDVAPWLWAEEERSHEQG